MSVPPLLYMNSVFADLCTCKPLLRCCVLISFLLKLYGIELHLPSGSGVPRPFFISLFKSQISGEASRVSR